MASAWTFGKIGLSAAEQLERRTGPHYAFGRYLELALRGEGEIQSAAVIGAARCALAIGRLDDLLVHWSALPASAVAFSMVENLCAKLVEDGHHAVAQRLAEAERERAGGVAATWLLVRVLDQMPNVEAAESVLAEIADHDLSVLGAATSRRAHLRMAWADLNAGRLAETIERYRAAIVYDGRGGDDGVCVRILRAWLSLAATSKFKRASALSDLVSIMHGARGEPSRAWVVWAAGRCVAEFADNHTALSAIERERVGAALRYLPDEGIGAELSRRFEDGGEDGPLEQCAQLALSGDVARLEASLTLAKQADSFAALVWRVVAHCVSRDASACAEAVDELVARLSLGSEQAPGGRMPRLAWSAVWIPVHILGDEFRDGAAKLAPLLLEAGTPAPQRGYISIYESLPRGTATNALRQRCLRLGLRLGEPVHPLLARELWLQADGLQQTGDVDGAIAALEEARRLSSVG